MSTVLEFDAATVVRGGKEILGPISWSVDSDQRWVVLGPNGAGKTTLFSLSSAAIHPTSGSVIVLDSKLGEVDLFEVRPRIGITSSNLVAAIPEDEKVIDEIIFLAKDSKIKSWISIDNKIQANYCGKFQPNICVIVSIDNNKYIKVLGIVELMELLVCAHALHLNLRFLRN